MPLPLRERQRDAVVRMLNLNAPPSRAQGLDAGAGEVYKVLVMDRFCFEIVTPLIKVNELRKHGVTLHLLLENDRERIADVPAVYFCQPTPANVALIANDFARNLYDAYHLNFSSSLPRASLEELAAHSVKHRAAAKVAKVFDQYVNFVSLGPDVFSLAQRDAYVSLNDPTVSDERVEGCVAEVVRGLFGACATLGRAPIIRCPRGGAAEMIARELEKLLRDHVAGKGSGLFANDLMSSSSSSAAAGGAQPSQQRPLLCIFDRNFDVAAALQHPWTYQPLVHDILGMRLNRVDVAGDDDALDKAVGGRGASKKSYELEESADPFWRNHGDAIFPRVAEEVEAELTKYKKAMADINDKTSKAGTSSGTSADGAPDTGTSSLVSAVASLPELQERKKMIDKHTNVATALLRWLYQWSGVSLAPHLSYAAAVHVRRGDRAIFVECPGCVNRDDPDTHAPVSEDRIQLTVLDQVLLDVNRSIARLRHALGREVLVFAASDTEEGLARIHNVLGEERVLTVRGRAVHSTRTETPTSPEAIKVAADFLALAMSDVLFGIGGSSFSGNAAAMHAGVRRVPYGLGPLNDEEIKLLRESFGAETR